MHDAPDQDGGPSAARTDARLLRPDGCSAVARGAASPALDAAFTKPFRWEVVPEPNPNCEVAGPAGEADTREAAEATLRDVLATYVSATGYVYDVAGGSARVRELARITAARPPVPKPPAW
jgi:hypothetical protein